MQMHRWCVADLDNLNAVRPPNQARGIYVLEFSNGERYVGKATDVAKRLYQHRRTTAHHEAWTDIVTVQFHPLPDGDLTGPERFEIERQRTAHTLRNRVHNLGHNQPSTLDAVIDPEIQQTWLDRAVDLDIAAIRERAAARIGKHAKVVKAAYGTEIINDLAAIIELFIPAPTETEGRFWSITDWPRTVGGRAFTLNVGGVELAYCSRPRKGDKYPPILTLNTPPGTFITSSGLRVRERFQLRKYRRTARNSGHAFASAYFRRDHYRSIGDIDIVRAPAGALTELLTGIRTPQQSTDDIRAMALAIMRQGGTPWAKSHSKNLATMAYRVIAERDAPLSLPERGVLEY